MARSGAIQVHLRYNKWQEERLRVLVVEDETDLRKQLMAAVDDWLTIAPPPRSAIDFPKWMA